MGAPRSGNTVISSVLNQNSKICLTAQSPLCSTLYELERLKSRGDVGNIIGNFPDYKSYNNIIKNLFDNYYSDWEQEIIFDRCPWGNPSHLKLLKKLNILQILNLISVSYTHLTLPTILLV